jgi:hypothetical protein
VTKGGAWLWQPRAARMLGRIRLALLCSRNEVEKVHKPFARDVAVAARCGVTSADPLQPHNPTTAANDDEGAVALWIGVFHQALADLRHGTAREKADAREWLRCEEIAPGSFLWVCEVIWGGAFRSLRGDAATWHVPALKRQAGAAFESLSRSDPEVIREHLLSQSYTLALSAQPISNFPKEGHMPATQSNVVVPAFKVREIAVTAGCYPRTVVRVLRGQRTKPIVRERILRALAEHNLLHAVPAGVDQ